MRQKRTRPSGLEFYAIDDDLINATLRNWQVRVSSAISANDRNLVGNSIKAEAAEETVPNQTLVQA